MQLFDSGHFERLMIERGDNLRSSYKLARGAECLTRMRLLGYEVSYNESDKDWALAPNGTNYANRHNLCAIPILDEDGYEASIYLDKFPELAPWIKGEGHSIIVTKGQDSEERIISEVYQISFSYPALIAVPYIRCIPANNGSISFACVRREFTYISTQSRLYQQGIDRLITETFKLAHPLEPRTQEVMP